MEALTKPLRTRVVQAFGPNDPARQGFRAVWSVRFRAVPYKKGANNSALNPN